jgi:hypothetical protein
LVFNNPYKFIFGILILGLQPIKAQFVTLNGYVKDSLTGENLIGASVITDDNSKEQEQIIMVFSA